ncbi:MAG: helix-turn-helix domain-containing protein [Chitinophagaceae bacterium]
MAVNILTKEDLNQFKEELFTEIRQTLHEAKPQVKQWLKSDEVKDLLKVSASTLQTLRINGTLTYTKLGGIIYYDYSHIEKVMKDNLREATKT